MPTVREQIRARLVRKVIADAYNWVTGGHENALTDYGTPMPTIEEMKDEVYCEVMHAKAVEMGSTLVAVQKDIRFLGTERIKQMIDAEFARWEVQE